MSITIKRGHIALTVARATDGGGGAWLTMKHDDDEHAMRIEAREAEVLIAALRAEVAEVGE